MYFCNYVIKKKYIMKEEDMSELIEWLVSRGYYVGDGYVASSLRCIADYFDD